MKMHCLNSTLIVLLTMTATASLANEKVTCKSGTTERTLEVTYPEPNKKVPCEVTYTKEGQATTPFKAQAQEGYCEEKLTFLKDKLTATGWNCDDTKTQ